MEATLLLGVLDELASNETRRQIRYPIVTDTGNEELCVRKIPQETRTHGATPLQGCEHFVMEECPNEVIGQLKPFLPSR